ncbi:hypothetical protein GBA52_027142 [Prunus armeniaca]|nr:hypothetical protein GBA52_027142 [Prunus armeniaca]
MVSYLHKVKQYACHLLSNSSECFDSHKVKQYFQFHGIDFSDAGPPRFPYVEAVDEVPDEYFDDIFNQASQISFEGGQEVGNDNMGTIEVPVYGHNIDNEDRIKTAVKNYAVMGNYSIKFVKNDKRRITARCTNCTWMLHASYMQLEETLQIKTFIDKHICVRNPTNPHVNCVYIAQKYIDRIMDEPDITIKNLKKAVKRDLGYNVSDSQCSRAKRKAKKIIEGTYMEQYSRLWEYCDEVKATNVGSTMKIRVEPPPHLQRLYVCLDACKKGFLAGCRPIIGVDGCHLKGPFAGNNYNKWLNKYSD